MSYEVQFHSKAFKEWKKLDPSIKAALKEKLIRRREAPCVPKAALRGDLLDCYKIKHESYRLVYQVQDDPPILMVYAVGKRDRLGAYKSADGRIDDDDA